MDQWNPLRRPSKSHSSQKHFFFLGHENFFRQIDPKLKISYITLLLIYKKIFFSGHFDEIFISKVDFCKFWLVRGLRKKIRIFDPRTPKWRISYILVKGLMGNFQFGAYRIIFWRGHMCRSKILRFFFTPMTPSKNDPISLKLKISH